MNASFKQLRDHAEETKRQSVLAATTLERAVKRCAHQWTEPKFDPKITPGGYDPGDPPGTMGIDRRLPSSWAETREPRWSRECMECGHVEYTTRMETDPAHQKPKF